MENDELYHYGVKGMKWGVRRNLKKRSREAARAKSVIKIGDKEIAKLNKSIARKSRSIEKKKLQISEIKKGQQQLNRYRNHLVKNMSQKDIQQGERYVKGLDVLSAATSIIPIVGPGVAGGVQGRKMGTRVDADLYDQRTRRNRR